MSVARPRLRQHRLGTGVATAGAVLVLALTGCAPGVLEPPADSASPTGTAEPSATATPEPSTPTGSTTPDPTTPAPSATTAPSTPPVAGELACSDVFTLDQLYAFNPNFVAVTSVTGDVPPTLSAIVDDGGTLCAFQHESSGDPLLIAATRQGSASLATPGFTEEAGLQVAALRTGSIVVAAASNAFDGESQARELVQEATVNLQ